MLDSGRASRQVSISFRQKHILLCLISLITLLIPAVSGHKDGLSAEVCEIMHAAPVVQMSSIVFLSFLAVVYALFRVSSVHKIGS